MPAKSLRKKKRAIRRDNSVIGRATARKPATRAQVKRLFVLLGLFGRQVDALTKALA